MTQRDSFSEFDLNVGPPAVENQEVGKPKEEMVPISRLNEANAQRDKAYGQRDEILGSMLNGAPDGGPATPPMSEEQAMADMVKVELPEGTDPEVAALITPIIEANNRAIYQRMNSQIDTRVSPVEDRFNYAEAVEGVASRVEGFETVREDIVSMFGQMSPEEQGKYNNEAGLEIMAYRALRIREANRSSRPSMAHSAPFGSSGIRQTQRPAMTAEDVHAMSDEEFEAFSARQ